MYPGIHRPPDGFGLTANRRILVHYTGGKLMISKSWSRKTIAASLAVAVLSVYSMVALAAPGAKAASGELSVSGQVTVNGQMVISGGTLFSDSVITTAQKSSATVNISKLGRVELALTQTWKVYLHRQQHHGIARCR